MRASGNTASSRVPSIKARCPRLTNAPCCAPKSGPKIGSWERPPPSPKQTRPETERARTAKDRRQERSLHRNLDQRPQELLRRLHLVFEQPASAGHAGPPDLATETFVHEGALPSIISTLRMIAHGLDHRAAHARQQRLAVLIRTSPDGRSSRSSTSSTPCCSSTNPARATRKSRRPFGPCHL
jgi:hypothetical protein